MTTTLRLLGGLCHRLAPPGARQPIYVAARRCPSSRPWMPSRPPQRRKSDGLKQRALGVQKARDGSASAASAAASDGDRTEAVSEKGKKTRGDAVGRGVGAFQLERNPAAPAADDVAKNDAIPDAPVAAAAPALGVAREDEDEGAATPAATPAAATADAAAAAVSGRLPHVHLHEFAPKIVVAGVGGAGTNAVNNMVASGLAGVEFVALNTDAQHLSQSTSPTRLQIGTHLTSGLGCGANPDAGRLAAEESSEAIQACIEDAHMVFITAGMGGGTGTGAAPVVAGLCYELGILTVSVVTTPFRFEGTHRKRLALEGVEKLKEVSDTLIVVPNQNLFRLVGEKTSFVDSFRLADDVLLAGVRSITDLMTSPGLINLDFADVQSVMHGMGNALLGTGKACRDDVVGTRGIGVAHSGNGGEKNEEAWGINDETDALSEEDPNDCRAIRAARMALNNPLLGTGNMDVGSAKGMLVNISGGSDMTLYEVDRAAEYITEKVLDPDANIIFGSSHDASLTGCICVSVVATGIEEDE